MAKSSNPAKRVYVNNLRTPACWTWAIEVSDFAAAHQAKSAHDAYLVLANWQMSLCAVCGLLSIEETLDHDHETGLVRGLLCHSCNTRENNSGKYYAVFINYRHLPPAKILDMQVRYGSHSANKH
jgi:Recombination endonuclease VII